MYVTRISLEDGNIFCSRNVVFSLEDRAIDKVQDLSDPSCVMPPYEPFRIQNNEFHVPQVSLNSIGSDLVSRLAGRSSISTQ
jgi:hypothetical protein